MVEKRQEMGYPSMKNQQHFRIHPMNSPHMHQYITLLFSLLVDFFTTQNPSRRRGTENGFERRAVFAQVE